MIENFFIWQINYNLIKMCHMLVHGIKIIYN